MCDKPTGLAIIDFMQRCIVCCISLHSMFSSWALLLKELRICILDPPTSLSYNVRRFWMVECLLGATNTPHGICFHSSWTSGTRHAEIMKPLWCVVEHCKKPPPKLMKKNLEDEESHRNHNVVQKKNRSLSLQRWTGKKGGSLQSQCYHRLMRRLTIPSNMLYYGSRFEQTLSHTKALNTAFGTGSWNPWMLPLEGPVLNAHYNLQELDKDISGIMAFAYTGSRERTKP